jgi:hypothetical protein
LIISSIESRAFTLVVDIEVVVEWKANGVGKLADCHKSVLAEALVRGRIRKGAIVNQIIGQRQLVAKTQKRN